MTLNVLPTNCDCNKCSMMCRAPCCGTPEDVLNLINAGHANRLSLDDWPGDVALIKPALKMYEGEKAPWNTNSAAGCTFWKNGLCELHESGLKPAQGKLANHANTDEQIAEICQMIRDSWEEPLAKKVIKQWKKAVGYKAKTKVG